MLGLPDGVRACLFDLDGVLTQTAKVHAAAWKEMFDGYLRERAAHGDEEFVAFDAVDCDCALSGQQMRAIVAGEDRSRLLGDLDVLPRGQDQRADRAAIGSDLPVGADIAVARIVY